MPPSRQPRSLLMNCVKKSIETINIACLNIERKYPNHEFPECQEEAVWLKRYLISTLPARLFDLLCSERSCLQLKSNPKIQLYLLLHPNMTMLHKCDHDSNIGRQFWHQNLPYLKHLVILDLKFICTDEILKVISLHCLTIEALNMVSKVYVKKSPFNASVLIRNVSDEGLNAVSSLKRLKILHMDPPRHGRANRVGRCISQNGICRLVSNLPKLEELHIDTCDIGSTLIDSEYNLGVLKLRKINCHFASAVDVEKLLTICPDLKELSITHFSDSNKNDILDALSACNLQLSKLELSFFTFTNSMHQLLKNKGSYIKQFSLWENENIMTLESLVAIGRYCPNLSFLRLVTPSRNLVIPSYYKHPIGLYANLKTLILGCENFDLEHVLLFFLKCTKGLECIMLKYPTKVCIDTMMAKILRAGYMDKIRCLWFDCTLIISKPIVKQIIDRCQMLEVCVLEFSEDMTEIQNYIKEKNYKLTLHNNY